MDLRRLVLLLAGVVVALAVGLATGLVGGSTPTGRAPAPTTASTDPTSGLPWVEESELPAEARDTLRLIDAGGPYPYDQDDATFSNREGLLPDEPEGYYREYTVDTPGEDDRGPRRIVTGDEGEYYWTSDHYASFGRIAR